MDDKKPIKLVFDSTKSDPEEAVKLQQDPPEAPQDPRGEPEPMYVGFRIQPAVNGGYVLQMEHTGRGPSDLYYCQSKEELLGVLGECLS